MGAHPKKAIIMGLEFSDSHKGCPYGLFFSSLDSGYESVEKWQNSLNSR
jgi:hypothetical protein